MKVPRRAAASDPAAPGWAAGVAHDELRRRTLHVAAGALGPLAAAVGARIATPAFVALVLLAALAELARHRWPAARARLERMAGGAFRPQEAAGLSGASTLALGFALAWWLFPAVAAERAILVAALADPVAATVGTQLGGGRRKSAAGSAAGAVTAALVLVLTGLPVGSAVVVAIAAAAAELAPWRGADNVTVPLVVGGLLWWLG